MTANEFGFEEIQVNGVSHFVLYGPNSKLLTISPESEFSQFISMGAQTSITIDSDTDGYGLVKHMQSILFANGITVSIDAISSTEDATVHDCIMDIEQLRGARTVHDYTDLQSIPSKSESNGFEAQRWLSEACKKIIYIFSNVSCANITRAAH